MGQKKIIPVSGEVTSSTSSVWYEVCRCTISTDCTVMIRDIWVNGRTTGTGAIGSAEATHRAKRVSGVLSLVGSIIYVVTHNSGSDVASRSGAGSRISVSGDDLILEVLGNGSTIEWYGGFTAVLN